MRSIVPPLFALLAALGAGSAASAQSGGKIPVEQDLRRAQRVEERVEAAGGPPTGTPIAEPARPANLLQPGRPGAPSGPGADPLNVRPSNPSGVVGFDGPPGIVGDSVGSYAPLPPGAPGNEIP